MNLHTFTMILFAVFSLGLSVWAMENNKYDGGDTNTCSGDCYTRWKEETGGVVSLTMASIEAKATASPAELGKLAYAGCVACHGAGGEGGIGPGLAGQSAVEIADKLWQYKNGETRGAQSALMWGQASMLSEADINNLSAYTESL